jgi:predicted nucleic acid-binding protein
MTAVIDTNVVLDYVLEREGFAQAAADCLERLLTQKAKTFLTASTITDIYDVALRQTKNAAGAKEIIAKLLDAFQIASVDGADCAKALEIGVGDYEDAVLCVCASKVKADCIITRNAKDFAASPVKVITPDDFLSLG